MTIMVFYVVITLYTELLYILNTLQALQTLLCPGSLLCPPPARLSSIQVAFSTMESHPYSAVLASGSASLRLRDAGGRRVIPASPWKLLGMFTWRTLAVECSFLISTQSNNPRGTYICMIGKEAYAWWRATRWHVCTRCTVWLMRGQMYEMHLCC